MRGDGFTGAFPCQFYRETVPENFTCYTVESTAFVCWHENVFAARLLRMSRGGAFQFQEPKRVMAAPRKAVVKC